MGKTTELINFLLGRNFEIVNEISISKRQIYFNGYLYIKILEDVNAEIFIELCCRDINSLKNWYDMDIIRFFILKLQYKDEENIRFEQLSAFFISNYLVIIEAFSEENFPTTETALRALQKERAKVLFGY